MSETAIIYAMACIGWVGAIGSIATDPDFWWVWALDGFNLVGGAILVFAARTLR